jgi:hypothetical protein
MTGRDAGAASLCKYDRLTFFPRIISPPARRRRMSVPGRGCVKTLTLDLRVEFLSRFRLRENQLHWQNLSEEGI